MFENPHATKSCGCGTSFSASEGALRIASDAYSLQKFLRFFRDSSPSSRIDLESLQKRFYELSRKWHPDRFSA